jgi:predicted dehydrogenase
LAAVNFILVGCGTIGRRHAQLCRQKGRLLAVCDILAERSHDFANEFKAGAYTSLKTMLAAESGAQALVVCTPNGLHAQHSLLGLKAGLHVLCEKPMALSSKDCRSMVRAAEKYNRHLVVVKQNRYNPPVAALKKLLDAGKLGKLLSLQVNGYWNRGERYYQSAGWRGTLDQDGGALFTQFSHFIDLLYWFAGELREVKGYIANRAHGKIIDTEDTGVFSFITKSGIPGTLNYTTNAYAKNMEGSLTLFAEKATVKIGGTYLNAIEYQSPEIIKPDALTSGGKENQYQGYKGSMNNHHQVYRDFIKLVDGKKQNFLPGEEAMKSVKMIEQFYHAASQHK